VENRLVEAAKTGSRPPAYWRTFLYFIAVIGLPLAGIVAAALCLTLVLAVTQGIPPTQDASAMPGSELLDFLVVAVLEVGLIVVTVIWVLVIDKRPIASIGLNTRRSPSEWLRGMGVGAGLMVVSVGLMAAFGMIAFDGSSLGNPTRLLGALGVLLFFLIQGPAEEIVFRGYLLPVLSARGNVVVGVVVSSLLFGVAHSINPNFSILPLVNLIAAGVMFALYALVEEGLWGVFGLHTAWNWVQGNVLGLAVSGGEFGPSLLNLSETGPDWLTGGAFGPEGSVVVTLLLVGLSMWLGWRLWRREQVQSATGEIAP
jgi:membrane protease YdiL (CAAX protease family)